MTTDATPPDQIETERLLLRKFRADDFDAVHAYATDEGTYRFMTWGPNTPEPVSYTHLTLPTICSV